MSDDVAVRLLLIADTHIPRRARALPAQVWAGVARADVVLHAGDWVDVALLDELERQDKTVGLATLCIASGMGAATIIERV